MLISLSDGRKVNAIGDPHLGRKFEVGVPLDRRGQREASQMRDFREKLMEEADVCIVVGDLFDYPFVPYAVTDAAANAIDNAASMNPKTTYIVYAGNHDLPRDITKVGAFHELVERLVDRYSNLHLVRRPMVVEDIAILPWEWDRRADEQVSDLKGQTAIAAFGHWDLVEYEGKDDHMAPTRAIQRVLGDIPVYTGHYHVAGDYVVDGLPVVCTGSMQPYAHDQDPDGNMYVTLPLADVLDKDEDYFKDKNVRVLLKPGEELPKLNALAVTPKRVAEAKTDEKITVSLDDFDWKSTVADAINKMTPEVKAFTLERLPHVDTAQQRRGSDTAS